MRKGIKIIVLAALTTLLLCIWGTAGAYVFHYTEDGNWSFSEYTNQKDGAEIFYEGQSSSVSIPLYITYRDVQIPVVRVNLQAYFPDEENRLNYIPITSVHFQTDAEGHTSVKWLTGSSVRPSHITQLNVPEGVTEVQLFRNNPYLKTVTLAPSVTTIGEDCFSGCSVLESIEMPGVLYFGNRAFKGTALREATLREGVTKITEGMFQDCGKLTKITIPDTVTEISARAFQGCGMLPEIHVPDGIPKIRLSTFQGCASLTEILLPESVTILEGYAFDGCSSLNYIPLPGNLRVIEYGCFTGCDSLEEITLPASLTEVSDNACPPAIRKLVLEDGIGITKIPWMPMNELEELIAPATVTDRLGNIVEPFPKLRKATISRTRILRDCEDTLEELTLLDPEVNDNSLQHYTNLRKLVLPEGLTKLPAYAFRGCTALADVNLPSTLTSIGIYAFAGCPIPQVTIPAGVSAIDHVFEDNPALTSVTVPNTVTTMESAFRGCTALKSAEMPWEENSVTNLKGSFQDCTALESIWINGYITYLEKAFSGCTSLRDVQIAPEGPAITNAMYTFENCTALKGIWLPEGKFNRIYYRMFKGSGLEETDLPESIQAIDAEAFQGCPNLYRVGIPADQQMTIGESAFADCIMLGYMDIPDTVTVTGSAFNNDYIELVVCQGSSAWECARNSPGDGIRPVFRDQITLAEDSWMDLRAEGTSITLYPPEAEPGGEYSYTYLLEATDGSWSGWDYQSGKRGATFSGLDPDHKSYIGYVWIGYDYRSFDPENRCIRKKYNGASGGTILWTPAFFTVNENGEIQFAEEGGSEGFAVIQPGVVNIELEAFANSGIHAIYLPESVSSIGERAFEDCSLTVYCPTGSWAEEWAKEQGIPCILLGKNE